MQEPTFEVVEMTPSWAHQILTSNNNKNRKIRTTRLKHLTNSILNGEWRVTSQGIALDPEGNLVDGQHRLAAVIKADRPIRIMLARNVDPSTFGVIDCGASRTASDALNVAGCLNSTSTAAAVKMYILYKNAPDRLWGEKVRPSHQKVLEAWKKKRTSCDELLPQVQAYYRKFRSFTLSPGLAFTLLAEDAGWREEEIMEFWAAFCTGANLDAASPILSYRNQLANPLFRRKGSNSSQLTLNCLIKCFNLWKQGKGQRFFSPSIPPHSAMIAIVPRNQVIKSNIMELIKS